MARNNSDVSAGARKAAGRGTRGRRKPGRPPGSAGAKRERLLDAAIKCYRRDGIAATTARSIAVAAGVTPALANYYFGSKEQLLAAVVAERIVPVVAGVRAELDVAGEDPRALARAFVRGIHRAVAAHPWFPALWVREVLYENGALRDLLIEQLAPQTAQAMVRRFKRAASLGFLPKGVDPRLLVVSLMGLTMFPLAAARTWRRALEATDVDSAALERHTLALLASALGAVRGR